MPLLALASRCKPRRSHCSPLKRMLWLFSAASLITFSTAERSSGSRARGRRCRTCRCSPRSCRRRRPCRRDRGGGKSWRTAARSCRNWVSARSAPSSASSSTYLASGYAHCSRERGWGSEQKHGQVGQANTWTARPWCLPHTWQDSQVARSMPCSARQACATSRARAAACRQENTPTAADKNIATAVCWLWQRRCFRQGSHQRHSFVLRGRGLAAGLRGATHCVGRRCP